MEQLLSDLALIRDGLLDATADYWVPLVEATATMPTWALAAAGAGALALLAVLIFGGRRLRGGDRLDRPDPFLRAPNGDAAAPHPVETHNAAIAMPQADAPTPGAAAPQPMEPDPLPDTPEIQGLAEILADRGLDGGGRDGRLRTFAGELDDLRARLATVSAGSASTAQLLRDARGAIASGDLSQGTDLLIRAADEEDATGRKHDWTAGVHGRAAALSRLVAGDLMAARDDLEEAATLYALAAEATPAEDTELKVECFGKLGALAHGRADYRTARKYFTDALAALEDAGGEDHPDLGGVLNNLGLACDLTGDRKSAEAHYQRALAADEKAWGDDHLNVAAVLNNLALSYRRAGKTQAAVPLFRRAVAIKEKHLMPGDASLARALVNLAAALRALGREEDAQDLERRAGVPQPAPEPEPEPEEDPAADIDLGETDGETANGPLPAT